MDKKPEVHPKLLEIRARKDLTLKPCKYLRRTICRYGEEEPLKIRYYQVQGILHLVACKRFLLGDDTGLGKCRNLQASLITNQGLVRLGNLAPKGVVLNPDTFYPLDRPVLVWTGWKWAPVKSYYHCGHKPLKKVRTRRGYELSGSHVHPVWGRRDSGEGFIKLQDAAVGDFLCLCRDAGVAFPENEPVLPAPHFDPENGAIRYKTPPTLNPGLAALLAYVVAEGWVNHPYHVNITQDRNLNPETHDHIRYLLQEQFSWEGNQHLATRGYQINVSSTYIRSFLEGLGVAQCLSADKVVPWPIFQGTRDSMAAFLRAFFDSEGSVTKGVVEVSSASEQLLAEIQILLLRFGIVCSRSAKKIKGREHTYWRLAVCGDDARMFHEQIGFLTPRKREALESLLQQPSNANLDVVPFAQGVVEALRVEIQKRVTVDGANDRRKGSGLKQFGLSFEKTLNNIRNNGRNPTYRFLQQMLDVACFVGAEGTDAYRAIQAIVKNHFFYDPIVSIEDGGEVVADIEVDDPDHSFVADGFVNHNTLQVVASLCYVWEKDPSTKAIVLTTKSAAPQWRDEILLFTQDVKPILCQGTAAQRARARDEFLQTSGPAVLIMGYRSAVQDFSDMQEWMGQVVIYDEATAFKNPKTQVHQVCQYLASRASRVWALTATLIKNHLLEGYGIYRVVVPTLFSPNINNFMFYYCLVEMRSVPKSPRKIPVVIGYMPDKIREFKENISPFYLGRPKHEVANELPALTTKVIEVKMSPAQEGKYHEALQGTLEIGDARASGEVESREVTKLTAITYCQQICNHLELLDCEGPSEKLDALIDLLTDGELEGEKVIIFTRFKKMVDIIMRAFKAAKIKAVRITGDEDGQQRRAAMKAFQNPEDDTKVVCITMAGSDAINLQAAKAIVFYDTPWSAGDFLQILGRMIRIGSKHDKVYAIHLVARGRKKTVDHRIMEVLHKKMHLVESVLGQRLKSEGASGDLDMWEGSEVPMVPTSSDMNDLFEALRNDAKGRGDAD